MDTTIGQLSAARIKLRFIRGAARGPLQADSLVQAAAAAIAGNRRRGWA